MNRLIISTLTALVLTPALAVAQDSVDPVKLVTVVIDMARTGQWLLAAIAFVQLLVFLVKRYGPEAYMKKWGSVSVAAGAGVIAILSSVVGGMPWYEAIIVFFAGPGCSLVVDFLHAAGILKRSSSSKNSEVSSDPDTSDVEKED